MSWAVGYDRDQSAENDAATATLYINRSDSRCGACNRSALPRDKRHETPCGYDQHPGCGAEFTAVSSDYFGMPEMYERIREMRPDLPFIDPTTRVFPPGKTAADRDERGEQR